MSISRKWNDISDHFLFSYVHKRESAYWCDSSHDTRLRESIKYPIHLLRNERIVPLVEILWWWWKLSINAQNTYGGAGEIVWTTNLINMLRDVDAVVRILGKKTFMNTKLPSILDIWNYGSIHIITRTFEKGTRVGLALKLVFDCDRTYEMVIIVAEIDPDGGWYL